MKSKRLFMGIAFVVLSGCAPYQAPMLSLNHPANAQAPAAPAPKPSKTLVYSRTDVPVAMATATPQSGHDSHPSASQTTPQKTVVGEGKVIATVPSANQLVVEHGEIKDFMEPMTMGYRVEPSSLLEGVKAGDRVRFTIDVPKKTIVKIEKMK